MEKRDDDLRWGPPRLRRVWKSEQRAAAAAETTVCAMMILVVVVIVLCMMISRFSILRVDEDGLLDGHSGA